VAEDEKTEGTSPAAATEGVTPDAIGERIDEAVADGVDVPAPTVQAAVETPSVPEIGAEIDAAVETAAAGAPAEPVEEPSARAPRGTKAARPAAGPKRPKTTAERGPYTRTPKEDLDQGVRRERRGVVTSDKGDKTITVRVDVMKQHPKYKKIMRRSISLRVHDETNQAHVGDTVRVVEARPMSRTKRWRLLEVVEVAR